MERIYIDITQYLGGTESLQEILDQIQKHSINSFMICMPREMILCHSLDEYRKHFQKLCEASPDYKNFPLLIVGCGGSVFEVDKLSEHQELLVGQWALLWQMYYEKNVVERLNTNPCNQSWNASHKGLLMIGKARWPNRLATIDVLLRHNMFDQNILEWSYYPVGKETRIHKELIQSYKSIQDDMSFSLEDLDGLARTLEHLENFELSELVPQGTSTSGLYFNGYPYNTNIYAKTGYTLLPESYFENHGLKKGMTPLLSEKYFRAVRNKHPALIVGGLVGMYDEIEKLGFYSFREEIGADVDVLCNLDPGTSEWNHTKYVKEFKLAVDNLTKQIQTKPEPIAEKLEHNYNRCDELYKEYTKLISNWCGRVLSNQHMDDLQTYLFNNVHMPYDGNFGHFMKPESIR